MKEQELKREITVIEKKVPSLIVESAEDFENAGTMVITLNNLAKKIKEYWNPLKQKAHSTWKEICNKENEMLNPVIKTQKMLKSRISKYLTEQDRIKREEQDRLDRERKKREENEKKKLEKRADRAEESGKNEKAEKLREQAEEVYIPGAIAKGEVEKTTKMDSGTISTVNDIEVTITDPIKVLKEIVSGKIPIAIVKINESKLKSYIKNFDIKQLDGVNIKPIVTSQIRGRA